MSLEKQGKYESLREAYPEFISLDQLYKICGVSKISATYLVENGIIPAIDTGKQTWRYKIALDDAITYLRRREQVGSMIPRGVATSRKPKNERMKSTRKCFAQMVTPGQEAAIAEYFNYIFAEYDEILTTLDIIEMTGLEKSTVLKLLKAGAINLLTMVMDGEPLPDKAEYILHGSKVDIIPCNINLSVTEINLRNELGGEHTLSELLEPLRSNYHFIIADTNPYLGLLTINALAACDEVIIPVSPQLWSATGLTDLIQTISKVKRKINPRIEIAGILLTICDGRTILFREAKALLDEFFGDKIRMFKSHIPSTVKVGEANYASSSILEYSTDSKAALAYRNFALEVCGHA